jgi:hypothetical protein
MSMKVHTFIGKANLEGLQQMDNQINDWLRRKKCEPVHINQCFGTERHHGSADEPVLITSVWYNGEEEEF